MLISGYLWSLFSGINNQTLIDQWENGEWSPQPSDSCSILQPVMTDDGEKEGATAGEPRTSPAPNLGQVRTGESATRRFLAAETVCPMG